MTGMVLHQYRDRAEYVAAQVRGNAKKLGQTWAREPTIAFLAAYLLKQLGVVGPGLCHGTRRGQEQAWFRQYLSSDTVFGTEIAPTATQFPDTIQWDFHEVKPGWLGAFDFIYSNSFDHAYDPEKALNAWMSCLRPSGLCLIEHSREHGPDFVTPMDPFGADLTTMFELIDRWGAGRYALKELLPAPGSKFRDTAVIVIAHTGEN